MDFRRWLFRSHRIPDYILEQWRSEFQVRNLSGDDLITHFAACEDIACVEYPLGQTSLLSERLNEGASNLGWTAIEAPRLYRYGAPQGRQSMSQTFIPRFLAAGGRLAADVRVRSEEHTSELQSLMRISYAVFCLKKKKQY